uniref:Butyrophilin subfamily 1 member A1 n=1 Tax=Larimichthys crocea TaxID=215358 RepID=A0A0F8AVD7_LARCR
MDRLILKPQVTDFSALVLHHIVVLLLLTHSCGGQSQVIDPSQPIVAIVGDDIILPCHLKIPADVDALGMTVEWARPDLDPRFVHLRRGGVELLLEEHALYTGRTSLFINNLKCGDISLKLSKVKLSDAGTYKCFLPTLDTESVVQLAVGSVSSPEVDMSTVSNGVLLECKSKGWYPEPEVIWLDAEGNLLSAGPTETVRGPDDLYTVSSRVTVEKSNSFTCRVQQKTITQTRETHIHVPAELFVVQSSSAVRISISLFVCFIFIGAVVFIMWRMRQTEKTKTDDLLMEDRRHGTISEKMKHLDNRKEKLEEDFQKKEEELKDVTEMITTLTEQKKNLKDQREKLTSLQEDNTQILKTDIKKKEKREKIKEDLEMRKREYKALLQNIEKLLETTEDLIIKISERKAKIETDKEQMNKTLKELEKEREETKKKLELEEERKALIEVEKETERKPEVEQPEEEKEKGKEGGQKGKDTGKNDPSSTDAVV